MFFILSKTVGFLAYPSNAFVLLGLLGLVLLATRLRRTGVWLMGTSLVLLAVGGWSPLGNIHIEPLELSFPPSDASRVTPDGIIVLGGGIVPAVSATRNEPQVNDAAERLLVFAALARRYPDARLVYSGGSGALINNEAKEADHAATLLERLAFPARVSRSSGARATPPRMPPSPRRWCGRNRASAGCWSRRRRICRGRSASFANKASRSKRIRSTGAPAETTATCSRSTASAGACRARTWRRASGLG
jgi:hypothetical protein